MGKQLHGEDEKWSIIKQQKAWKLFTSASNLPTHDVAEINQEKKSILLVIEMNSCKIRNVSGKEKFAAAKRKMLNSGGRLMIGAIENSLPIILFFVFLSCLESFLLQIDNERDVNKKRWRGWFVCFVTQLANPQFNLGHWNNFTAPPFNFWHFHHFTTHPGTSPRPSRKRRKCENYLKWNSSLIFLPSRYFLFPAPTRV